MTWLMSISHSVSWLRKYASLLMWSVVWDDLPLIAQWWRSTTTFTVALLLQTLPLLDKTTFAFESLVVLR